MLRKFQSLFPQIYRYYTVAIEKTTHDAPTCCEGTFWIELELFIMTIDF